MTANRFFPTCLTSILILLLAGLPLTQADGAVLYSAAAAILIADQGTDVVIPNTYTSIGHQDFKDSEITSLTIPDSVTEIGSGAFYGWSGLTSITIPDSVTSIRGETFSNCSGLISVIVLVSEEAENYPDFSS